MANEIDLVTLRESQLKDLITKLIVSTPLAVDDSYVILRVAVVLLKSSDVFIKKLGYRIIVLHTLKSKDVRPLYDVSLDLGYIPLSKYLMENFLKGRESFISLFTDSFVENFRSGTIFQTVQQQKITNDFFKVNMQKNCVVVAPTSYGKSGLIAETIKESRASNVCIVVPTKALLSQTKKRILSALDYGVRIITHPDMYMGGGSGIVAVLTQERLMKMLQKDENLSFDIVFIDEAHNLLKKGSREKILAGCIVILRKRKNDSAFKYLTPFLIDVNNLKVKHANFDSEELRITEYLKTEKIFLCDFMLDKELSLYDQFLDCFLPIRTVEDSASNFIFKEAGAKNIIYHNGPRKIESFARGFFSSCDELSNDEVSKISSILAENVHPQYFLIKCLKYGFVYHHGSMPDTVKLFVEESFSTMKWLKFIVSSSTLLEGVNIPAEKLFVIDYKRGQSNLSQAQFKNLMGRVSRFNEIFKLGSPLDNVVPEIFLLKTEFSDQRSNLKRYTKANLRIDSVHPDKVENVLLENSSDLEEKELNELYEYQTYLENIENGTIHDVEIEYAKTPYGIACISNNLTEVDVFKYEHKAQELVHKYQSQKYKAKSAEDILGIIVELFIQFLRWGTEYELVRLRNESTQNAFRMLLRWKMDNVSFPEMVNRYLSYWRSLESTDPLIYAGNWGEVYKPGSDHKKWINISEKTDYERVNLAIVRVKEDQDFIDYNLMKFVDTLAELSLLDEESYHLIHYGTNDQDKILLIRSGISSTLANLLIKSYSDYLTLDHVTGSISFSKDLLAVLIQHNENELMIFELKLNIK